MPEISGSGIFVSQKDFGDSPEKSQESLLQSPQNHIRGFVGRPRKPPSIKYLPKTGRWRVLATIAGKQKKKIVRNQDEAKLVAHQWSVAQDCDLQVLPTRLTPVELRQAEAAKLLLDEAGVGILEGAKWLVKNYRRASEIEWKSAIADYKLDREKIGLSKPQISNVTKVAQRLAKFTRRERVANLTREEIEEFFNDNTDADTKAATYNGMLGNIRTFCRWLVAKKHLAHDPTEGIERRRTRRGLPDTLRPENAAVLLRDVEATDPKWVPYVASCLFGAIRPSTRNGEACRLDADLRAGKTVFHDGGIEIRGKANGVRILPWEMCGPLREWLKVYPPGPGLWPCENGRQAEREWARFRARHDLGADVLRHTGISAMVYAPNATFAKIAIAAGNSESMIRKHYLGRWSESDTKALWSVLPALNCSR